MRKNENKELQGFIDRKVSCLSVLGNSLRDINGIDEITFEKDDDETKVVARISFPPLGNIWFDITDFNIRTIASANIRKRLLMLFSEGEAEEMDFDYFSDAVTENLIREGILNSEGLLDEELEDELDNEVIDALEAAGIFMAH